ncbi:hypothetical protein AUJ14_01540 [Candidatus Micrarchaeota archaeon CG1_02_55_22]|nr:MAG: hypothetical protein AUJ14_01540 [Candidatus Micrarchaeota archaeon CG1_02_55_22]
MSLSFACKPFDLDEVVRCGLGLSKSEMRVFSASLRHAEFNASGLAQRLGLDRTTVQKAASKLLAKGLLKRLQRNRDGGGYEYVYAAPSKTVVRERVRVIAGEWFKAVDAGLEGWP